MRLAIALLAAAALLPAQDSKAKVKTARELAKQGSQSVAQLTEYLKDPEVEVRVEAVKALVTVGTQHSLDPLILATRDNDPEVQIRATDGLVNFYLPGYVQTGLTANLKRTGNKVMSRWSDTNDAIIPPYIQVRPEVISALASLVQGGASLESRANAARAAGILRGKAAIPAMVEALKTKDDTVLYEVLVALQKIRDPEAAPRISFLLNDLNDKVQIAAFETVGLLQNKDVLPQLRTAYDRARNDKVKRAALSALAMMPDEANRPLFTQNFTSGDEKLRAGAAEGIARLGNKADGALVGKAFAEEKKMAPRLSLAFAAVKLGNREVSEFSPLQYLINTLNSKSWRGIAQPFLVELSREPEVRASVYRALPAGTRDEKIMLAQILAISGDNESVAKLEPLTRDADAEVAQEALRALRTLKARLP